MNIFWLSVVLLLIISVDVQGLRTKRILPTNENCDPQNEVCKKGDWVAKDIADCQRTGFWWCKAQNSVFYSWIVDVARNDGCEPMRYTRRWFKKIYKRFVCGSAGTNTRCVCSDYKILPNECRCQYWPEEDPGASQPAFCTGYYTGGTSKVHHWACCNNCNDKEDGDTDIVAGGLEANSKDEVTSTEKTDTSGSGQWPTDNDNTNDEESSVDEPQSCDGLTWHGGSTSSYCGSCGNNTGGGRPKYHFNCGSCSQQNECKDYCSGPIRSLPGFCWLWLDCFKGCCLARNEHPTQGTTETIETMSFCGDGTCGSGETSSTCPSDCCYQVNSHCDPSNPNFINEEYECCGDVGCCLQ